MSIDMGMQYALPKNKDIAFALTIEAPFNQLKGEHLYNYGRFSVTRLTFPNTQCIRLSMTYSISNNGKQIKVNKNENDTSRFAK